MKIYVGVLHNHEVNASYPTHFGVSREKIEEILKVAVDGDRAYGCAIESEIFETEVSDVVINAMNALLYHCKGIEITASFYLEHDNSYSMIEDGYEHKGGVVTFVGRMLDVDEVTYTGYNSYLADAAVFVG